MRIPAGDFKTVLRVRGRARPGADRAVRHAAPGHQRRVPRLREHASGMAPRPRRARVRRPRLPGALAGPPRLAPGDQAVQPVTHVSWFAAAAYCEAQRARLPTWHEWEYVAAADATRRDARDDPAWRERILAWYAQPSANALPAAGARRAQLLRRARPARPGLGMGRRLQRCSCPPTAATRAIRIAPVLRRRRAHGRRPRNYAVLMRVAMLSSLGGSDTTMNLGFRCVREMP